MVGYEVVHRNERRGRFISIRPWDRPMSGRIGVMIGRWARWSDFDYDWRNGIVGDGWQVGQLVSGPRGVPRPRGWVFTEGRISVVVPTPPWITGRDREPVRVMIARGGWERDHGRKMRPSVTSQKVH